MIILYTLPDKPNEHYCAKCGARIMAHSVGTGLILSEPHDCEQTRQMIVGTNTPSKCSNSTTSAT